MKAELILSKRIGKELANDFQEISELELIANPTESHPIWLFKLKDKPAISINIYPNHNGCRLFKGSLSLVEYTDYTPGAIPSREYIQLYQQLRQYLGEYVFISADSRQIPESDYFL